MQEIMIEAADLQTHRMVVAGAGLVEPKARWFDLLMQSEQHNLPRAAAASGVTTAVSR